MTVIQEKQPIPKQYWSCLFLFLFFSPHVFLMQASKIYLA